MIVLRHIAVNMLLARQLAHGASGVGRHGPSRSVVKEIGFNRMFPIVVWSGERGLGFVCLELELGRCLRREALLSLSSFAFVQLCVWRRSSFSSVVGCVVLVFDATRNVLRTALLCSACRWSCSARCGWFVAGAAEAFDQLPPAASPHGV